MDRKLIFVLGLLVSLTMNAQRITEQQALEKARQFMQGKVFKQQRNVQRVSNRALPAAAQSLYIFNVEDDGGFVIVAGDERADAILGYATSGNIDEEHASPSFRDWLTQMAMEVERSPLRLPQGGENGLTRRAVTIHAKIDPLILTEWNQGNSNTTNNSDGVYNSHLPKNYEGKYPCTGCVATAGAQVMYYYRWPEDVTQVVPGYSTSGFDTKSDLPAIQFDWEKMKTRYVANDPDKDAVNAVADLMLYCGYAAHMKYGVDESTANTSTLAENMVNYFGYSDSWQDVYRYKYSISEWDELIYNELAAGRPIIYSGSYKGGHAFICDGYDGEGMYHFNWGWGGWNNGYFKLQATNPSGADDVTDMGYIADNHCIIGLQPTSWPAIVDPNADDVWEVEEITGIVATTRFVSEEEGIVTMPFYNMNEETYGFGFGIGELNSDGSITPVDVSNEGLKDEKLEYRSGYIITFDFASYDLPEGTHTLVPISLLNGETEWKRCKPVELYFTVEVSGDQKTIVAHPIEKLTVNDFDIVKGGEPGMTQGIRINITNEGDNTAKQLYVFVGSAEDDGKSAVNRTVKIAAGNTKEYHWPMGKMDAGSYTLRLATDYNCENVLAQKEVTIKQELVATQFDFVGKKRANKVLRVDATVENHAGDYAIPLYLFASTTTTKTLAYAAGSAIESGSSEIVSFYFQPNAAGTWNLWVATDKEGKNIIGQTIVDIEEQHEATLTVDNIEVKNLDGNIIKGENIVEKVDVTNTGEYTYDDVMLAVFYKWDPDAETGKAVDVQEQEVTLEPGEKTSIEFTFENPEDGGEYFSWIYYYSLGERIKTEGTPLYQFVYTPEEPVLVGDVNGDGAVDISDYIGVANHILGNTPDGFNAEAADVNGDNVIDISDYIGVANIILTGKP